MAVKRNAGLSILDWSNALLTRDGKEQCPDWLLQPKYAKGHF